MGQDPLLGGSGNRLGTEVGYGLKLGQRFVGTPRMGVRSSQYGREYRVDYSVTALEQGTVNLELAIDAERREMRALQHLRGEGGSARQRVVGRASLGW